MRGTSCVVERFTPSTGLGPACFMRRSYDPTSALRVFPRSTPVARERCPASDHGGGCAWISRDRNRRSGVVRRRPHTPCRRADCGCCRRHACTGGRRSERSIVHYEPLPTAVTMAEALDPDAPLIHPQWRDYEVLFEGGARRGNVAWEATVVRGDCDHAFMGALRLSAPGSSSWDRRPQRSISTPMAARAL
jgi:hypothetical protein